MVAISEVAIFARKELLARNCAEGFEDFRVGDSAAFDLPLDHRFALGGEVCEGFGHGPPPISKNP
jgi:hypothetical protein